MCVCGYGYISISMLLGHNEGLPQWHQMRHMVSNMLLFHQHILDTFFFMSIVTALKAGTVIYLTNTLLCVVHLECFQMFTIFICLYIVVYNYHSG